MSGVVAERVELEAAEEAQAGAEHARLEEEREEKMDEDLAVRSTEPGRDAQDVASEYWASRPGGAPKSEDFPSRDGLPGAGIPYTHAEADFTPGWYEVRVEELAVREGPSTKAKILRNSVPYPTRIKISGVVTDPDDAPVPHIWDASRAAAGSYS